MKTRKYTFHAHHPDAPTVRYPIQVNASSRAKAIKQAREKASAKGWNLENDND